MNIKIRSFSYDKDLMDVYQLHRTVFGRDSLEAWKKRWAWEYRYAPGPEYMREGMWVAERQNGVIVGFQGSFPQRIKIAEKLISTYYPGDLAVDPDSRRKGLGQKLAKAYMDNEECITMAYNYAPATGRIFRRLGLTPVSCVPKYVRPFDLQPIFHFLVDFAYVPSWLGRKPLVYLLSFGCKALNFILSIINYLKRPGKSADYAVEEVKEIGSEFDDLWNEISVEFPIIFVRDAKFIKWRFLEDPIHKHTLLAARDNSGKLKGYIDILIGRRGRILVGKIMDVFCSPENQTIVDDLLAKALEIFSQHNVAFVTCLGLHPALRENVKRYFYLQKRRLHDPALLNWKGHPNMRSFVENPDNWHLTHADGDHGFSP